jgi:hypothetical protein
VPWRFVTPVEFEALLKRYPRGLIAVPPLGRKCRHRSFFDPIRGMEPGDAIAVANTSRRGASPIGPALGVERMIVRLDDEGGQFLEDDKRPFHRSNAQLVLYLQQLRTGPDVRLGSNSIPRMNVWHSCCASEV